MLYLLISSYYHSGTVQSPSEVCMSDCRCEGTHQAQRRHLFLTLLTVIPMLVVRKIMFVDRIRIVHHRWQASDDLPCLGRPVHLSILSLDIKPHFSSYQRRKDGKENELTHASQTNPLATNPNKLVSASVGRLPPNTKNIPSGAPDPRFRLEAVNSASMWDQTSVFNFVISGGVSRPVPWP